MSRVGSVFLGDLQQLRHLASPPSSPPPITTVHNNSIYPSHLVSESTDIDMDSPPHPEQQPPQATPMPSPAPPTKIDPLLALELRLRWLEALILGIKQDLGRDRKAKEEYSTAAAIANLKNGETLSRLAEMVQQKLNKAVQGNEGLTKFMDQCMSSLFFFVLVYPRMFKDRKSVV